MARVKEKKKKRGHFFTKDDITGYLFVLPFLIGFIFLFAKPMVTSIIYSFHDVSVSQAGIEMEPLGFSNYEYALFSDADFVKRFTGSIGTILWNIPIIMFFSMFIALLLNEKFVGRLFFRSAMFLPVIFGTGVILFLLQRKGMVASLFESNNSYMVLGHGMQTLLTELMANFGISSSITGKIQYYINNIFDISWKSGIQIILFIIGLQSIPSYLYEVCKLEGATKWETFWKITFPMLSPTILLCLIYTIIDQFNSSTNQVIELVEQNMREQIHYACAQTWMYSLVVFAFVFVVYRLVAKRVIYLD